MNEPVGILGVGYLGSLLSKQIPRNSSWGTHQKIGQEILKTKKGFKILTFEWGSPPTWEQLPFEKATLVLTIPPLLKDLAEEKKRVEFWCQWMVKNRPNFKKLVYISTTGVYPDSSGIWTEEVPCEADSLSGKLRLATEKLLSQYFKCKVIRPGAIYGRGRHVALRLLRNEPLYASNRMVHRIHVADLATITLRAIEDPHFPNIMNAVDQEPSTSLAVLKWLCHNVTLSEGIKEKLSQALLKEKKPTTSSLMQRKISNKRLIDYLDFPLSFPDFRKGMEDALVDASLS